MSAPECFSTAQRLRAEFIGTAFLLTAVVGSGIMAERLMGGNVGLALLANTLATGAVLVVLITMFGPVSGAHFNPVVSLVLWMKREVSLADLGKYLVAQVLGGIFGVLVAHLMFDEALLQLSATARTGPSQWLSEAVAAFGLLLTILLTRRSSPIHVPMCVGLYITSAYWFTASTSFANPAVTLARALSDSFAGIRPMDVLAFIVAQVVGAMLALAVFRSLEARTAVRVREDHPAE